LLAWVSSESLATEENEPARCLAISDIHFNPFLHPDLFEALTEQPASEWTRILDSSLTGTVSVYGSDSNYPLMKYDKLASRSSHDDPAAYRNFTAKTVEFLALEFQRYFPGVPVLPTIGNEDAYCGDYEVQPAGPFLEMFARAWMALPGEALEPEAFRAQFSRGGYYSAALPSVPSHRIVVLNSVFFSNQFENACGSHSDTPGDDEMAWLAAELDSASRASKSVWLVMHIPLGINDYNTVKDEETDSEPVEFWLPGFSRHFVGLVNKFENTVQVAFSGHTHMDDFRVIEAELTPLVLNKLVPSISPIFRNNPGFQVYFFYPSGSLNFSAPERWRECSVAFPSIRSTGRRAPSSSAPS
jgi:hypothetical protein